MTLIVYKDGVMVADRLVVDKHKSHSGVSIHKEVEEEKLIVTPNRDFAYAFNNDVFPEVVEPILIYLRRFEKNKLKEEEPAPTFDIDFKLLVMSKRHFYSIYNDDGLLTLRMADEDTYITPNGSYRHYDGLSLSAVEIFETMLFNSLYMATTNADMVTQKSLNLIRR